jgi:hypothetical protein
MKSNSDRTIVTTGRCLLAGLALAASASSSATVVTVDSLASSATNGQVQTYLQAAMAPGSLLTASEGQHGNAPAGKSGTKTYASTHFTQAVTIPEPSSLPLLGLGLALAVFSGWRARRGGGSA